MDLIVVGSVALDDIYTPTGSRERCVGGSASYFSLAASHFVTPGFVGVVGEDFPEEAVATFRRCGVDVTGLERVPGRTFRWAGRYHDDLNERTSLETELNVFERFHPKLPATWCDSPWVFLGNIHPSLQLEVLNQIREPRFVAMDTMDFWIEGTPDELRKVLARVDAVIINDGEARKLAGVSGTLRAARAIAEMGPRLVVVKRGEFGAMLWCEGEWFFAPAFPVDDVVDPTGAGDAFAGGMLGYLARAGRIDRQTVRQALVAGSVVASFSIEAFSIDRLASLTSDEINARIAAFRDVTDFELPSGVDRARVAAAG